MPSTLDFKLKIAEVLGKYEGEYGTIKSQRSQDRVSYEVHYAGTLPMYAEIGRTKDKACYSWYLSSAYGNPISCYFNQDIKRLSFEENKKFIELCVKSKMCPEEHSFSIVDGETVFKVSSKNKSLLYAGLCAFRYVDSMPALVAGIAEMKELFPEVNLIKLLLSSLFFSVESNGGHDPFYYSPSRNYDYNAKTGLYEEIAKDKRIITPDTNATNLTLIAAFINYFNFNTFTTDLPVNYVRPKFTVGSKFDNFKKKMLSLFSADSKLSFMDSKFDELLNYFESHNVFFDSKKNNSSLDKILNGFKNL